VSAFFDAEALSMADLSVYFAFDSDFVVFRRNFCRAPVSLFFDRARLLDAVRRFYSNKSIDLSSFFIFM
jgi:hypothetical protein